MMNVNDQFENVWKQFLKEKQFEEPDRITRTREWAMEFFKWMKDSGLLTDSMY